MMGKLDALDLPPAVLAMREELNAIENEKDAAFKDRNTSVVAQVRYDIALERYVMVTVAYRDMIRGILP
jgi:hypothetical protein